MQCGVTWWRRGGGGVVVVWTARLPSQVGDALKGGQVERQPGSDGQPSTPP